MVTVRQSGGDYTTLKAAIDADETTIDIDQTWTISEDQTATITVDATFGPTITCSGGAETIGRPWKSAETTYRLRHTGTVHLFTMNDAMTIIGMDFQNTSTGASDECFRVASATGDLTLTDCVGGFAGRVNEQDLYHNNVSSDSPTIILTNCAFYNCKRDVIDIQTNGGTWTIDINSCSFYEIGDSAGANTRSGIVGMTALGDVTVRMFNSSCHINTGVAFTEDSGAGTTTVSVDRCVTNQATWVTGWDTFTDGDNTESTTWEDTGSPSSGEISVEDITTSPFDLRLQDHANNMAQDNHADGTGAGLTMPATDIIGTSRPQNTNHDIGMFEIVAAGGGLSIPVAMASYRRRHELRI